MIARPSHRAVGRAGLIGLALVAMALALVAPFTASASTGKSFSLTSVVTSAVVHPDASMEVTELVTYSFSGGPFTVGIRSFENDNDSIANFAVRDADGRRLRITPPAQSISGDWEWEFRRPLSNTTATFTVRYTVADAVSVYPDVGELYWQFLGTEHPGVGYMSVSVDMPGDPPDATADTPDDDASVLRAWGHGPENGTVELTGLADPDVTAQVSDVPASTFVELRILSPSSTFTVPPTGSDHLASVIEEEGGFIGAMTEKPNALLDAARVAAPIAAVAGVLGLVVLWIGFGREPTSREVMGDYWREPLDDPPAIALANLHRGSVNQGETIAATLVDMAQRGYLTITNEVQERFGPDKSVYTFRWAGKPYKPDVRPFEAHILEMVFRGQPVVTDDEVEEWGRANRTTAASKLSTMTGLVKKDFNSRGYEGPTQGLALALLALVCLVVGGTGAFAIVTGTGLGWVAVVTAVLVFVVGLRVLANRTQAGAEAAAKAEGLKKYLRDFSNLEDAPIGHLILWERFLVYAVAFGVADELLRGMAVKLPTVVNDPAFGVWYVGRYNRFDGIGNMGMVGSGISTSFTPPSKSGSGGGFSGGGGGGGGGGGFGAR